MAAWLEIICMGRKGRCLWRTKSASLSNKLREPLVTLGWQLWIAGQCLLHLFLPVIQGACASGGGVTYLAKLGVWQRQQATVTSKTLRDIYRAEKKKSSEAVYWLNLKQAQSFQKSNHLLFITDSCKSGCKGCCKAREVLHVQSHFLLFVLMVWEPSGAWAEPCFSFWTKKRHQIQANNRDKGTSVL